MSDRTFIGAFNPLHELETFLDKICVGDTTGFVKRLAERRCRWSSLNECLSAEPLQELRRLAYLTEEASGFSDGNLKAHYVLDEDFVDGGSALIVFALVGSTWTHVVRVIDQAAFVPRESWLDGDAR